MTGSSYSIRMVSVHSVFTIVLCTGLACGRAQDVSFAKEKGAKTWYRMMPSHWKQWRICGASQEQDDDRIVDRDEQTPIMRLSSGAGVLTRLQLNGPARLCTF